MKEFWKKFTEQFNDPVSWLIIGFIVIFLLFTLVVSYAKDNDNCLACQGICQSYGLIICSTSEVDVNNCLKEQADYCIKTHCSYYCENP